MASMTIPLDTNAVELCVAADMCLLLLICVGGNLCILIYAHCVQVASNNLPATF